MPAAKEYSEQTAELVDSEIKKILSEIHGKVSEILGSRRAALDGLANLLLEKETVERSQLQEILSRKRLNAA
jgi:cell division protease FtsH